jgi:hypothetical protein
MGTINTQINGANVAIDTNMTNRWINVEGQDVQKFIWMSNTVQDPTYGSFVVTATGSSTMVASTTTIGNLSLLTTGANAYDGVNAQVRGESFKFESGKPMYFGCKITPSEATQSDLLVGLCKLNTGVLASASAHGVAGTIEGAFLYKLAGSTVLNAATYVANVLTNVATYGTAFSTAAIILEFYWDGATFTAFANGNVVGTFNANMPTVTLTPTLAVRTGSGGAITYTLQWFRALEIRNT